MTSATGEPSARLVRRRGVQRDVDRSFLAAYAHTARRGRALAGWRLTGSRLISGERLMACVTQRTSCCSSNTPLLRGLASTRPAHEATDGRIGLLDHLDGPAAVVFF
jgi:hypothetical protein